MGMRYQPTGTPEPRDNRENGDDRPAEAAESEMVDLGESPLPSRLDVPPASVRAHGRRLDPRLAAGVAVSIVVVAVLGTGPLAPKPTTGPSHAPPSSLVAVESSPAPTDACPVNSVDPVKPPVVSFGQLNTFLTRKPAFGTGASIDAVDVVAPVAHVVQVDAARRMQLRIPDVSCVELLGIDLFDAGRPHGTALTVRAPAPLERGSKQLTWDGPPAGDWIVRVALQLRTPGGETDSIWAVYLYRLNSGYVAWQSPVPSSGAGGSPDGGPIVTPAVACGPLLVDTVPPGVELRVGATVAAGVLGEYQWRSTTVTNDVREALLSAGPIEVDGPVTLAIAGNTCATSWYITAGVLPVAGEPSDRQYYIDQAPDNPSNNPRLAAQNVFSFASLPVLGTFVLQTSLEFENGDRETVYWLLHAPVGPVPNAFVVAEGSPDPIPLALGCGVEVSSEGRYGVEVCEQRWPTLPDGPALDLAAAGSLRIAFGSERISGWVVELATRTEIETGGRPQCPYTLTSGYSGLGLGDLELPPLPSGDWIMRVSLTSRDGENSVAVPYFVRVRVEGAPTPLPTPICGDF